MNKELIKGVPYNVELQHLIKCTAYEVEKHFLLNNDTVL